MSLVSYASSPLKALAVPSRGGDFVQADDFVRFHGGEPEGKTRMRIRHDRSHLFVEAVCFEPSGDVHAQNRADEWRSVLRSGDHLEIFFGTMGPEPYLLQFVVNAGGGRCDNLGKTDLWSARVETGKDRWKAEIAFPLSLLPMHNLSLGFNLCRYAEAREEFSTWCALERSFHEVENFGLLLMADYADILFAETGVHPGRALSRAEFESEMEKLRVPAHSIAHGPWLSNPSETGMTVSFGSAGICGAFLEYAPAGSGEWIRRPFEFRNGILLRNRSVHVLHLDGLRSGTRYQYRIRTLHPLTGEELTGPEYAFTTLDGRKKEFSFSLVSDIHSNINTLRRLLALDGTDRSDFLVNLGDYLSCACGEGSCYNGFLDLEAQWCRKTGKPLVFVRGNHEQIGIFAGVYENILPRPDGKTCYTFRHGSVFFIALDGGNDKPDDDAGLFRNAAMLAEEKAWLREVVRDEAYRSAAWRIVLIHAPPRDGQYDARVSASLLALLPEADLVLSGHIHRYLTISPEDGICFYKREGLKEHVPENPPCPVVANDTDTMIRVHVSDASLDLEVLDQNGVPVDSLHLTPRHAVRQ